MSVAREAINLKVVLCSSSELSSGFSHILLSLPLYFARPVSAEILGHCWVRFELSYAGTTLHQSRQSIAHACRMNAMNMLHGCHMGVTCMSHESHMQVQFHNVVCTRPLLLELS